MRPIDNIAAPTVGGVPKSFGTYQEWRSDLAEKYGQHCVFCNDKLPFSLNVEHLQPQSDTAVDPLAWDNLSLACGPCNLAKSDKLVSSSIQYLPNAHNTHLPFDYNLRKHAKIQGKIACIPVPKENLSDAQKLKAEETIRLTALDRVEQDPLRERKMTDVRWQNRFEAFEIVKTQRNIWDTLDSDLQRVAFLEGIPPQVVGKGFFSLWMNAFEGISAVLAVIVDSLPGTAQSCFDTENDYQAIPRNPDNVGDPI
jgi:hypothetical protein